MNKNVLLLSMCLLFTNPTMAIIDCFGCCRKMIESSGPMHELIELIKVDDLRGIEALLQENVDMDLLNAHLPFSTATPMHYAVRYAKVSTLSDLVGLGGKLEYQKMISIAFRTNRVDMLEHFGFHGPGDGFGLRQRRHYKK